MRVTLAEVGGAALTLEVRDESRVVPRAAAPAAPPADPAAAVRAALEQPLDFPPLRRALTPEDRVAVVVDERLPHLAELLTGVLGHVTGAGVDPGAVTLVCPPPASRQGWIDDLPDEFQAAGVEVHDPADRRRLAYLATTRDGRRVYLNRSVVDADQTVVLAGLGYDPLLGYAGGPGAVYPALSDADTLKELAGRPGSDDDPRDDWPLRREATEVAWLLGAPFFVQVIPGAGDTIERVLGGPADSVPEGQRLFDERWRVAVDRPATTVVATLGGDPARQDFADLARAAACAARVVEPDGRIVILCRAAPALGAAAALIRDADEPAEALGPVRASRVPDRAAALLWLEAAWKAKLFLLSGLDDETAEELFATPMQRAGQVQRLVDAGGTCLFLPDAHRTRAEVIERLEPGG